MKIRWILFRTIFQVVFIVCVPIFTAMGYKHLEGNTRFLSALQSTRSGQESREVQSLLRTSFPNIESTIAVSIDDPVHHVFQLKEKGSTPVMAAWIQKEIACASCRRLNFLLVTDLKGAIVKIILVEPLEVDGKKIDATAFLKQFEGRRFDGPVLIGAGLDGIKEAPSVAGALAEAISDGLVWIRKYSGPLS